jgi:hypothetical protein
VDSNEPDALGRYALAALALGREDDACEVHLGAALAKETLLVPVYCTVAKGDLPGGRLALQLARGGADVGLAATVIGRLRKTPTRASALTSKVGVIDYLFLSLGDKRRTADLAAKAEPELLFEALYAPWPSHGKA